MNALRRVAARLQAVGRVVRQIAGMPDYERYVEHMQTHHPGERIRRVLDREALLGVGTPLLLNAEA